MSMFGPPQPPMSAAGKTVVLALVLLIAFSAGYGIVDLAAQAISHIRISWR